MWHWRVWGPWVLEATPKQLLKNISSKALTEGEAANVIRLVLTQS